MSNQIVEQLCYSVDSKLLSFENQKLAIFALQMQLAILNERLFKQQFYQIRYVLKEEDYISRLCCCFLENPEAADSYLIAKHMIKFMTYDPWSAYFLMMCPHYLKQLILLLGLNLSTQTQESVCSLLVVIIRISSSLFDFSFDIEKPDPSAFFNALLCSARLPSKSTSFYASAVLIELIYYYPGMRSYANEQHCADIILNGIRHDANEQFSMAIEVMRYMLLQYNGPRFAVDLFQALFQQKRQKWVNCLVMHRHLILDKYLESQTKLDPAIIATIKQNSDDNIRPTDALSGLLRWDSSFFFGPANNPKFIEKGPVNKLAI